MCPVNSTNWAKSAMNPHSFIVLALFSYGFPMVFLWFSYGFPMVSAGARFEAEKLSRSCAFSGPSQRVSARTLLGSSVVLGQG